MKRVYAPPAHMASCHYLHAENKLEAVIHSSAFCRAATPGHARVHSPAHQLLHALEALGSWPGTHLPNAERASTPGHEGAFRLSVVVSGALAGPGYA